MPRPPIVRAACIALAAALAVSVLAPAAVGPAEAGDGRFHRWARQSSARIRPGNWIETPEGSCTTNFVFTDRDRNVYLGTAAHCFSTDPLPVGSDGCAARTRRLGTRATVQGARYAAVLVHNSWRTMRRVGERRDGVCANNDFALVRLSRSDRYRVNPTVPVWGGPRGLAAVPGFGEFVSAYGNSPVWAGQPSLRRKQGVVVDQYAGGWAFDAYSATPGVSGDSGSGYMLSRNRAAVGVLSVMNTAPFPASNGVISLKKAISYMKAYRGGALDTLRIANAHR